MSWIHCLLLPEVPSDRQSLTSGPAFQQTPHPPWKPNEASSLENVWWLVSMATAHVCRVGHESLFKSRWWWLRGHHLGPAGPGWDPPGGPPGTPCLRRGRSRCKLHREQTATRDAVPPIVRDVRMKDTVFISSSVLGWSRHVEQDQVSSLRLVDHHLVQLDSCVHPTNIRLVPSWTRGSRWWRELTELVRWISSTVSLVLFLYRHLNLL